MYVKFSATNAVGTSSFSEAAGGAIIITNPDAPASLQNNDAITNYESIGLTWQEGASNGGSSIIDYRISYDNGIDGNLVILASNVVETQYTASGLTSDIIYTFKIEARNAYGYSGYSSDISIRAASVPDAPTSLQNDASVTKATQIGLTWSDGPSSGGSPVLDYRI